MTLAGYDQFEIMHNRKHHNKMWCLLCHSVQLTRYLPKLHRVIANGSK